MKRYVDFDELLKAFGKAKPVGGIMDGKGFTGYEVESLLGAVYALPKAEIKETETATAIQNWDGWMDGWQCSYCKDAMIGNKPNYCPNCGRKFTSYQMKDGEAEGSDEEDD